MVLYIENLRSFFPTLYTFKNGLNIFFGRQYLTNIAHTASITTRSNNEIIMIAKTRLSETFAVGTPTNTPKKAEINVPIKIITIFSLYSGLN